MTERAVAKRLLFALAVAAVGCGHPEQRVVDQYFSALNQGDNQTLSSFAAVKFDQKVDKWEIIEVRPEQTAPAQLADLHSRLEAAEAAVAKNKKDAQTYSLDNYSQIQEVQAIKKKNGKIPRRLEEVAATWDKYNEGNREHKKAAAQAKAAYEAEKRYVALSVSGVDIDEAHTIPAELITKEVDLALTIGGQEQRHRMTLRKYNLSVETGRRVLSRWMIFALEAI